MERRHRLDGAPLRLAGGALLLSVLIFGIGVPAVAQDDVTVDRFRDQTEVSSILIPVTVRDSKGRLVANLEQKKFHLLVDGIEFPIHSFWREGGLPLSIAFVLDTSGSMGGRRLSRARQVILEFVRERGPDDEMCLITFGGKEVKRRLKFGVDPALLPHILEPLKGYGLTTLYDVMAAAPQIMEGAKNVRRVILVFTDGVDTASGLTADDVAKVMESITDPLYVFGIEPPPPMPGAPETYEAVMERLAKASGGRYIRVGDVAKLPQLGQELRRELTMRYIITLQPSGIGTSKWRTLEVKVDGPYQAQTRRGYRGTLP